MRLSVEHDIGYTEHWTDVTADVTTLIIKVICHHGCPNYLLQVIPVSMKKFRFQYQSKFNTEALDKILSQATQAIIDAGGVPISLECNNCVTNRDVYNRLGGPGKINLECDYVFKNNWSTVVKIEPSFTFDNKFMMQYGII